MSRASHSLMGERIARYMRDHGIDYVEWGDRSLVDISYAVGARSRIHHPLHRMGAVLDAMKRSPELFESYKVRGHDRSGKPRVVRGFKLISS